MSPTYIGNWKYIFNVLCVIYVDRTKQNADQGNSAQFVFYC